MSICDPFLILNCLGIDVPNAFPVACYCPCCGAPGKLEIRHPDLIRCQNCGFFGDTAELYAAAEQIPLKQAVERLASYQFFPADEIPGYLVQRTQQQALREFFSGCHRLAQNTRDQLGWSLLNRLLYVDIEYQDYLSLGPIFAFATADEFREVAHLGREASHGLRVWGKRRQLIIPTYAGSDIVGVWVIVGDAKNPDSAYIPIGGNTPAAGTTNLLLTDLRHPNTVVVDNPLAALRLAAWSAMTCSTPRAFVSAVGRHRPLDWAGGRTLYWSPTQDLHWLLEAMDNGAEEAVLGLDGAHELPAGGNWALFEAQLSERSQPLARAIARQILDLPLAQAQAAVYLRRPNNTQQKQILATVEGADRQRVEQALSGGEKVCAAVVGNKTVTEHGGRWMVGGQVISDVTLHLETVEPEGQSGRATITGFFRYDGEIYDFRTDYGQLVADPGGWLRRQVVSRAGKLATIASNWSKKLLDVAKAFHQPTARMPGSRIRWENKALICPRFVVDRKGIRPSANDAIGPAIPWPEALTATEQKELLKPDVCRLLLLSLGALLSGSREQPPAAVYMVGGRHWLPILAEQWATTPTAIDARQTWESLGSSPMPVFCRELPDGGQTGWAHAFVSCDRPTARALHAHGGWIELDLRHLEYPQAVRAIWLALADGLSRWDGKESTLYTAAAAALGGGPVLRSAADKLRDELQVARMSLAGRFLYLAAAHNLTQPHGSDHLICRADVDRYFAGTGVPRPDYRAITRSLKDDRLLVAIDDKGWVIDGSSWSLYRSFAASI